MSDPLRRIDMRTGILLIAVAVIVALVFAASRWALASGFFV